MWLRQFTDYNLWFMFIHGWYLLKNHNAYILCKHYFLAFLKLSQDKSKHTGFCLTFFFFYYNFTILLKQNDSVILVALSWHMLPQRQGVYVIMGYKCFIYLFIFHKHGPKRVNTCSTRSKQFFFSNSSFQKNSFPLVTLCRFAHKFPKWLKRGVVVPLVQNRREKNLTGCGRKMLNVF